MNKISVANFRRIESNAYLYAFAVVVLLFYFGQITNTYISHDEFDWLVPSDKYRVFQDPLERNLTEGRWLSYLWVFVSYNLDIRQAYTIFFFLFSALFWLLPSVFVSKEGYFSVICATTLMFSPVSAEITTWPASTTPAALVALSCIALMLYFPKWIDYFAYIGIYLSVMAYPLFSSVCFISYLMIVNTDIRGVIVRTLLYFLAYISSVLTIFALNFIILDFFGISPASWRNPQPLDSFAQLIPNLVRYLDGWIKTPILVLVPLGMSIIGYAACIIFDASRRKAYIALWCGAIFLSIDAAIGVINGIEIPIRSSLWAWIIACLPSIWLYRDRRLYPIGIALIALNLCCGLLAWSKFYAPVQNAYPAADNLAYRISAFVSRREKPDRIVTFGDVRDNRNMSVFRSNRVVALYLYKKYHIYTTRCEDAKLCDKIYDSVFSDERSEEMFMIGNDMILVFSNNNRPYW